MSEHRHRRIELAGIAVAATTAAIICVFSYLTDQPCRQNLASSNQIDLLEGNLPDHWWVFGSLSAKEVNLKSAQDGVVEVDVLANSPSWSDVSSGVSYTAGLFAPGWYEFTGQFRADADAVAGYGGQIEVRSSRWSFVMKAESHQEDTWKNIDVYFRPADSDPVAEVSCRFWGNSSHRAGRAFLRNMRLVRLAGAPPPMGPQADLERKEEARLGKPERPGGRSVVGAAVTLLFLGSLIGVCWRLLE